MKQSFTKMTALFLAVVLCVSAFVIPISASLRSSLYLDCYRAWLTAKSGGKIDVTVDVQGNGRMEDIGASRVQIFESTDDGETWKSVKIYLVSIFPELYNHNTGLYCETPITYSGTPGNKYCAVVTVYAGDSTGGDSRDYTTPSVTAIK